ncbi:hypothetical protein [Paenibacillus mucilaginosus]|uniref:Uncharacterized protein n=3 Tax=Paenibacillus mucilaginosus TaxID=61624 RepID=H6NSK9_9BACL|nr:hypothetical protein [Paenibacillus mucilaginosus]AEI39141.1 hypothetical protein KNP414_00516 [Paenibacillus mucilaginosus KNP414]AFC27430.1 hypothetical protein PM3016_460 [Paenibacillus mucilaginosus 3016]AFH59577.1 hypothetical protein B2K_02360 [Paenibacillus mucilaginosus K02]
MAKNKKNRSNNSKEQEMHENSNGQANAAGVMDKRLSGPNRPAE